MSREHQFMDFRQHCRVVLLLHLKFLLHTEGKTWTAVVLDLLFKLFTIILVLIA